MSNALTQYQSQMSDASLVDTRGVAGSGEQVHSLVCTLSGLRRALGPKGLGLTKEVAKTQADQKFAHVQAKSRQLIASAATDQKLIVAGFRFNEKTGRITASMIPKVDAAPRGRMAKVEAMLRQIKNGEKIDTVELDRLLAGIATANAKKAAKAAEQEPTVAAAATVTE